VQIASRTSIGRAFQSVFFHLPPLPDKVANGGGGKQRHLFGNTARFFGLRLVCEEFDDHAGGFEKFVVTGYLFAPLPAAIPLVCEGKKHAFFRP